MNRPKLVNYSRRLNVFEIVLVIKFSNSIASVLIFSNNSNNNDGISVKCFKA